MIMRYKTIQRYRTNFETLKPATIIAEEWNNLDGTQKNRLSLGGSKSLGHGPVASSTINHQIPRQSAIVHKKILGGFFKPKEKSSSDKSLATTNRNQTPYSNSRNVSSSRPCSALITNEMNTFEFNNLSYKTDFTPTLTKSALIYQLIRSRLEANLTKSISANKDRTINKEFFSSSTNS